MTFAAWGVDFVKADWCNTAGLIPEAQYAQLWSALNKTGRKIWFNTCEWGLHNPWTWARSVANSARIHGDHHDTWFGEAGTANIIESLAGLARYAGPGYWNDPDFLMTGLGNQSPTEYRTEFSLWSITASQLLVATDIRNMTALKKEILLNTEILQVNQDPLGQAGDRVAQRPGGLELWTKLLHNGDVAFVVYNPQNATSSSTTVAGPDLGWNVNRTFLVRDLWAHKTMPSTSVFRVAPIPAHGVFFGRASQLLL